jgi:hypothetical protein
MSTQLKGEEVYSKEHWLGCPKQTEEFDIPAQIACALGFAKVWRTLCRKILANGESGPIWIELSRQRAECVVWFRVAMARRAGNCPVGVDLLWNTSRTVILVRTYPC